MIFLFSLISLYGFSIETYKVSSDVPYNIRKLPNVESEIMGSTKGYEEFEVYEIVNGWAKIIHGDTIGYVKSDCLVKSNGIVEKKSNVVKTEKASDFGAFGYIFTLAFVLFVFSIVRFKHGYLRGWMNYANWAVFLAIIALEILILSNTSNESFLPTESDSPIFDLLRFIFLLLFTALMQIYGFFKVMSDISYTYDANFFISDGVKLLTIGFVLSVIIGLIWGGELFLVGLFLTILSQFYFALKVFGAVLKGEGNFVTAILSACTYLIGLAVTCIITSVLFVIIVGVLFVRGYLDAISQPTTRTEYRYY